MEKEGGGGRAKCAHLHLYGRPSLKEGKANYPFTLIADPKLLGFAGHSERIFLSVDLAALISSPKDLKVSQSTF